MSDRLTTEKQMGIALNMRVSNFYDAKRALDFAVSEGIVRCDSCGQPATCIHWIDQAEYYFQCEAHRDYRQQWVGHTHWTGNSVSIPLIVEKAQAWYDMLADDEKEVYDLENYDATNYHALIEGDGYLEAERFDLCGTEDARYHVYAKLYPLVNGQFAYEIVREMPGRGWARANDARFSSAHHEGIVGMFQSPELAINAAKKSLEHR